MKFSYSIPLIGSVEITLTGCSQEFYYLLEKKGEIKRLQGLEHLGILHNVFPGMQHTRWDYTITILYLIQQFSESKIGGLSATREINGLQLSGRDMMQLLALATNIGHIPGTFGVEKGIARYLVSDANTAQELREIAKPPGNDSKTIDIDYINLNKFFVLVKLGLWISQAQEDENKLNEVVKILAYEVLISEPKTEHRKKIRDYFNFIRRVSYQLLDCLYVNLPIKIDYSRFISQLPHLLLQREQIDTIAELTDHYTRIVYKQVYHSDKARKTVAVWADEVYKFLTKQNNSLDVIKKWLNSEKLTDVIKGSPEYEGKPVFSCILPHKFGVNFIIESFKDSQVEKLEIGLMRLLKEKKVVILYIPGLKDPILGAPQVAGLLLEVYANGDVQKPHQAVGLTLVWIYRQFKTHWGVGLFLKAGMETLLSYISKLKAVIEPPPDEFFRDDYNPLIEDRIEMLSSGQFKGILHDLRRKEEKGWDAAFKEQFNECKVLKELTKRKWKKPRRGIGQYWVIVPGRIKFADRRTNDDKCEFDGALLSIETKRDKISKMMLYLIEAKAGYSTTASRAKNELRRKLGRIGFNEGFKVGELLKKNAYAEIELV